MIKYSLRCINEHEFEAWFKSMSAYEEQAKQGIIECSICGENKVSKALMAPAVQSGRRAVEKEPKSEKSEVQKGQSFLEAISAMRDHVEDTCDYVGENFAMEARKISKGESEERGIYGEATEKETTELNDEGIQFFRLPTVPRRTN